MNPGKTERIIEVEPLRLPAPLVREMPASTPEPVLVPASVPQRVQPEAVPA